MTQAWWTTNSAGGENAKPAPVSHKATGIWLPEALAEFPRRWSETTEHRDAIAADLNEKYGMDLTGARLASHASSRGFRRTALRALEVRKTAVEVEATRSRRVMDEYNTPVRPADNVLRRVVPGSCPVPPGGYRMGERP